MGEVTTERSVAFQVLRRTFEEDEYTERAFRSVADSVGLEGRSRALAQFLSFGSVQRRGTSDGIVGELSDRSPGGLDPAVIAALRLGLFELFFSESPSEYAAVDQAVELARESGAGRAAGFVNAILRRAIRERAPIEARLAEDGSTAACAFAHSMPPWLVGMWWEELGSEETRSLSVAANLPAERCLIVNRERADAGKVVDELESEGIDCEPAEGPWPLAPEGLFVVSGNLARAEALVAEGKATILSRGSAAVVEVLGAESGDRILDLCAGPGIKTGLLAEAVGQYGNLVAVEPNPGRAEEVAARIETLGFHNTLVVEADGTEAEILSEFDRVLVDAPCSDLGALNSRPDARWRKREQVVERLVPLQSALLDRAASMLRPGGTLVYSTCTISRRENVDQASGLADRSGLLVDDLGSEAPSLASPADSRFLQLMPDRDRTTGFFIARFRKPLQPEQGG